MKKLVTAAVLVAGLAAALPAVAATPIFKGTVGPGFTISMAKPYPSKAGTVTLVITDKANNHNFHLRGPGGKEVAGIDAKTKKAVKKVDTGVAAKGTRSYIVKLAKGKYTFVCDPHASFMKGSFTVK